MILDAGYKGFGMFELGRVGVFIALAGILYLLFFSSGLLPEARKNTADDEYVEAEPSSYHRVEAVIGVRFPGINKRVGDFNFARHYGAEVKEIKRSGVSITNNLSRVKFMREIHWCYGPMIHLFLHGGILLYLYCWLMVKTPNRKVTGKNVGLH